MGHEDYFLVMSNLEDEGSYQTRLFCYVHDEVGGICRLLFIVYSEPVNDSMQRQPDITLVKRLSA